MTFAASATQPVIPASWTVPNWYFDPANSSGNASDQNNCTTSGTPCSTWGEIWVHRLGAGTPQLQQVTTFNQLSSQTLNTDFIYGTFQLSNGAQAILKGQLTQVCTIALNTATVTAQVRGGPGTRWAVSNACTGEVAKTLLQDTTANTWAFVDSVSVGTATISQPLTNALVTTVGIPTLGEGSMSTNDAFTVWSLPLTNLKVWQGQAADLASAANSSASAVAVQNVQVADSSGAGASSFSIQSSSSITLYQNVLFPARMQMTAMAGRGQGINAINTDTTALISIFAGGNLSPLLFGGIARGGLATGGAFPIVDGDAVMHSAVSVNTGGLAVGAMFTDGSISLNETSTLRNEVISGPTAVWGSGSVQVNPGCVYWNGSGTTFALSLLTSGALRLGANTTGTAPSVSGTFVANGSTQVDVAAGGSNHWSANASIALWSSTAAGTPGAILFSATQAADAFHVKSTSGTDTSTYGYRAFGGTDTLSAANFDKYNGMYDEATGARFSNTQ